MKVRTRPYPRYTSSLDLAAMVFLFLLEDDHPWVVRLSDWLDRFTPFPAILEWYTNWRNRRRVQVRVDRWDTWNADHTLAQIILPVLREFRSETFGVPQIDNSDLPAHLHLPDDQNTDQVDFDFLEQRWHWILDEIIWGYEQLVDDNHEDQFYDWGDGVDLTDLPGTLDRLKVDREGLEAHNKRIEDALILFGRYYRSLWN